jgi:RimJ/RimL family protein N-acetyltransferase
MRHEFTLEGPAFRLRPIGDADAPFVVKLRNTPELSRYIHRISDRVTDQLVWFAKYYERPDDYYFVLERLDTGAAEGVISVYDIDSESRSGEWGRWILRPGSLAAVESAWLIYRCSFERIGLDRVYCRTVAENQAVVSFHDSCGITQRRLLPGHFHLDGKDLDAVEHEISRQTWDEIGPKMQRLAELTARRVRRG